MNKELQINQQHDVMVYDAVCDKLMMVWASVGSIQIKISRPREMSDLISDYTNQLTMLIIVILLCYFYESGYWIVSHLVTHLIHYLKISPISPIFQPTVKCHCLIKILCNPIKHNKCVYAAKKSILFTKISHSTTRYENYIHH